MSASKTDSKQPPVLPFDGRTYQSENVFKGTRELNPADVARIREACEEAMRGGEQHKTFFVPSQG